jgi:serine/threonine protein kinase
MYTLLAGQVPFDGTNDQEILKAIFEGKINFDLPVFLTLAPAAKDLIKKILVADTSLRPSAAECLNHPWIVSNINKKVKDQVKLDTISALKGFNGRLKMQ